MKPNFFESFHCKSGVHCNACRNDLSFRQGVVGAGMIDTPHFDCPEGKVMGQLQAAKTLWAGGSTDHEREAAGAGYAPSCCGSAANPNLQS